MRKIENQSFLLLLVAVTLGFGWVLLPFYGAILWAIVVAVIFAPLNRRLQSRMRGGPNLAAAATVLIVLAMVILPLGLITASLLQEASTLFAKVQSGEYNFAAYTERVFAALPAWMTGLLDRFNLTDLGKVRDSLAAGLVKGGQAVAPQALSIGMNTFEFIVGLGIMLYLLFFLLRDGQVLARRIKQAVPLRADQKTALFGRFADVVRATVKGSILVAIAQGALGGLAFWFLGIHAALLWGVLMAFLSLVPAIGAGLVWVPVAIYFFATGAVWQGVSLNPVRSAGNRAGGQSAASFPDRQGYQAAGLCRADLHARRYPSVRPQRFCNWTADRSDVHGDLGNLFGIGSCIAAAVAVG